MSSRRELRRSRTALLVAAVCVLFALTACGVQMRDQPSVRPYEPSAFFEDGLSVRPIPANTVPRGALESLPLATGMENGEPVETIPVPITAELLARGQERYDIYCTPCHGLVGDGQGMIVQRGFPQPPSFHLQRLREAPAGHYFDVISNGFGRMYAYSSRVPVADRWAIIAYIRALQLSQNADVDVLSPDDLEQLVQE